MSYPGPTLNELAHDAHSDSRAHGWYDSEPRNLGEMLMLITTEVAEAMEEVRNGDLSIRWTEGGKPEGWGIELADIIIRVLDLAQYTGVDIGNCVTMKMSYNATRPYRHGGKTA